MIVGIIFHFILSSASASASYEPEVLDLHNLNVSSFPLNTTSVCKSKKDTIIINVFNSSLTVLPSRLLKNCELLDWLNLSNNKIVEIKHNAFENLPELNVLDLSLNQINAISRDVFAPLVALSVLDLQGNKIQVIHSDLFQQNSILFNLNLSNNKLKTIHSDLFLHNEHLSWLKLNNNSLKTIQPKAFRNNLNLYDLYVNDNRYLSSIDLFPENRTRMSTLDLSNCGFAQLYIPKNVDTINAKFNKIKSITAHPENVLRDLKIDHNNLTDFAQMTVLKNLNQLSMFENPIELINFNNLKPFENLTWLSMNVNPTQNISEANLRINFPKINSLYINSADMSIDQQRRILDNLRPVVRYLGLFSKANIYNKDGITN